MKQLIIAGLLATLSLQAAAQAVEGVEYTLPKTALHFTVTVEKSQYTPGEYADYTLRYLKKNVSDHPCVSYRLLGIKMTPKAVADTSKHYTLMTDKKHSISNVELTDDGRLLAINTPKGSSSSAPEADLPLGTTTVSGPHPTPLNPRDYMTEDILQAGSKSKMAELTAQEIYDIRDSRNQLSRGEADNLPKDGAQLNIMMTHLDTQEQALLQLFEGTTVKDTLVTGFDYMPEKAGKDVLFRFSKWMGVVDKDDLGGSPYYISITDLHSINAEPTGAAADETAKKKEDKNDIGLHVNQPDKVRIALTHDGQQVDSYEVVLPQFGKTMSLSGELFGKKLSTRLVLSPVNGSIIKMEQIGLE
jgi:hypothetical protein